MKLSRLVLFFIFPLNSYSQLLINEFSSKGNFEYEVGESSDWIEIINNDSVHVNLSNYYISDKSNQLNKWRLPNETLLPNDIILICLSGLDISTRIKSYNSIFNDSTVWRCLAHDEAADTTWNYLNYDDSFWSLNNLNSINDLNSNYFFVRKEFINKGGIERLTIDLQFKVAFVAFLNGYEVARSKSIYGNPPKFANSSMTKHNPEIFESYTIEKEILDQYLLDSTNIFSIQFYNDTTINDNFKLKMHCGLNSDSLLYNYPDSSLNLKETYYHSNFKLSVGETLFLSNSKSDIIDFKNVEIDIPFISEGRSIDSLKWGFFNNPSPNMLNSSKFFKGISASPEISLNSGWYDNNQFLTIISPDNSEIYYTTNGDLPDTLDNLYTDTIFLDSSTVLSVRSFKDTNHLLGNVVDRVYLINENNYNLPVISIITDSLNLWGNTGIYAIGPNGNDSFPFNGANFWENWNRFSRLIFFDDEKNELGYELFDLKIHGGGTRAYPQKSFRLNFRSRYTGNINWDLFDQKQEINSFNNLNVRNGGGYYGRYDRIRDGLISILSQKSHVDYMGYQPCVLYLNGEFWGQYALREKVDEHYVEGNHGISSESINMLSALNGVISGTDKFLYETFHTIMNIEPSNSDFYEVIDEHINLDNYIDYFIIQTYIKNGDWYAGINNLKTWQSQSNGKLNYVLYDTDQSFHPKLDTANSINFARNPWRVVNDSLESRASVHSMMFDKILKNENFKCRFIKRYLELVDLIFHPDTFTLKANDLQNKLSLVINDHFERWPGNVNGQNWYDYVQMFINKNQNRYLESIIDLGETFSMDSLKTFTFDTNPKDIGKIIINTRSIDNLPHTSFSYDISCFNNADAFSYTSNFVFSHWLLIQNKDSVFESTIDLNLIESDTLIANFRDCSLTNVEIKLDSNTNIINSLFNSDYGPFTYDWFLNDDLLVDQTDSLFSPKKSGTYHLEVNDNFGCKLVSNLVQFNCDDLMNSNVELINDNKLIASCVGGTEPYSYEWNIDSTLAIFNENYIPVLEDGQYSVIITDFYGCKTISVDSVHKSDDVQIYPNPTNDFLNLLFLKRKNQDYRISIFDLNHNLHYNEIIFNNENDLITNLTLNLTDKIKPGLYFVRLNCLNESIYKSFIFY